MKRLDSIFRQGLALAVVAWACSREPAPHPTPRTSTEPAAPAFSTPPREPVASAEPVVPAEPTPASRPRFSLQPLGAELASEEVELVAAALRAFYDFDLVVEPPLPLPQEAYYPPRSRYRAERLLDYLSEHEAAGSARTLGLTAVDISTTKDGNEDWGVLGLAAVGGRVSVISSFRTRRGAQNAQQARVRLAKTAVHEIGHTLGLAHCPEPGCLMEDAQGTVLTTDREYELCHACRGRLEARGQRLGPVPAAPPWPRP